MRPSQLLEGDFKHDSATDLDRRARVGRRDGELKMDWIKPRLDLAEQLLYVLNGITTSCFGRTGLYVFHRSDIRTR
jgi:hypothetical protein